ncbi:lactonase family protein [Saccharopolyspora sp. NFXS83]|uniref:lactonase family protein n=1 Tax=Saccharopolyspora sp. NFXS83 TaxID=2993560 RepID=UPI00224ADB09|nr:lactonase family protein [Saccharopolyspora sp. NFXS83]MCX2729690.1 lactonase family protein [Saccharopolyspora sp. NFXS83]
MPGPAQNPMRRRHFLGVLAGASALPLLSPLTAAAGPRATTTAYVGSLTSAEPAGLGLEVAGFDAATGKLTSTAVVEGVPDASFFAFSPDGRVLYTTNEQEQGKVTALSLADPAAPAVLGSTATGGSGTTHLTVHPDGYLLTANYTDGTVSAHPIAPDGSIGEASDLVRHDAAEPHAHQVLIAPGGDLAVAVDLGADAVFVYALENGKLVQRQKLTVPTGTGPRHLAWHPDGGRAYLLAEYASTITVLDWDGAAFTAGQVLGTRDEGATGENFPAEIAVSGDGAHVYASNRGDDTIAVFAVRDDGLERLGSTPTGGQWPRHFAFEPGESALHVVNQRSGTITRLARDAGTGLLAPAEESGAFAGAVVLAFGS